MDIITNLINSLLPDVAPHLPIINSIVIIIGAAALAIQRLVSTRSTIKNDAREEKKNLEKRYEDTVEKLSTSRKENQDSGIKSYKDTITINTLQSFQQNIRESAKGLKLLVSPLGYLIKSDTLTVLVASENEYLRETTKDILIQSGYNVILANTIFDALNYARKYSKAELGAAIIDVHAYEEQGLLLAKQIRMTPTLEHIPIILLLTYTSSGCLDLKVVEKDIPGAHIVTASPLNKVKLEQTIQNAIIGNL